MNKSKSFPFLSEKTVRIIEILNREVNRIEENWAEFRTMVESGQTMRFAYLDAAGVIAESLKEASSLFLELLEKIYGRLDVYPFRKSCKEKIELFEAMEKRWRASEDDSFDRLFAGSWKSAGGVEIDVEKILYRWR